MTDNGKPLRVAAVQICATPDAGANLVAAEAAARDAAEQGAQWIAFPEAFDCLVPTAAEMHAYARPEADHPAVLSFTRLSRELGRWLLAGSVSLRSADDAVVNRSLVFSPEGVITARYDKIHLFDIDLPNGESSRESDFYRPGGTAVVADLDGIGLGLGICYDIRFPQLFRALGQGGARVIATPAAFSNYTGPLHWEPLLRARAIETGCFVVAAAQCGDNYPGRVSHGQSMIIDPWGRVMARAGDAPAVILADLDLEEVDRFRTAIPSLARGRDFALGEVAQ